MSDAKKQSKPKYLLVISRIKGSLPFSFKITIRSADLVEPFTSKPLPIKYYERGKPSQPVPSTLTDLIKTAFLFNEQTSC